MRALLTVFSLAAVLKLDDANAARVLGLFPHTGKSHQMVFDPLLRTLAERGHHVTVVSFFPVKNPPENYTDVSLEGIAGLGLEVIDLAMYENGNVLLKMLGLDNIARQLLDFEPLAEMALDVCSKLVSFPPLVEVLRKDYDVILVENFNSDCMLGLSHVYGKKVPVIGLLTSSLMQWSADRIGVNDNPAFVPVLSAHYTSRMNFYERLENTFLNVYFKVWFRYNIQLKEQEIIERHFGRRIPDLRDLAKNTTLLLANVFHSLNGVRPLIPGLVEVGGMHLNHKRSVIPPYIERFMNESDHGVVLLSFGSLIKTSTMPEYKERMIISALSRLKQRVIWKFEESEEEGTLEGNVMKVRWIPQYDLLRHKKVLAFIGHGGLLGMTEAISAGKPMVVVPFFGDQPYNAAMAEEVGLGVQLPYEQLTEESLLKAVQTVLSAEMRLSARRVSKIWHDRETKPLDTAVYWTERVIRWGYHDKLYSAARDLNFIEHNLLDVAAAFVLAIIVLVLIAKLLLTAVLKIFKASISGKDKEKLH
uniref:UDP-glucuronosyltransferase n=1 Tax=Ostrinia furnacalis TaxID=93504 RepID=A0A7H1CRH6_OSTFU|nr:UDP-glycosyltransferase UGT46A13 [Ostrinia furnacalis]